MAVPLSPVGTGRIAAAASLCAVAACVLTGLTVLVAPSARAAGVVGTVAINESGLSSGVFDVSGGTLHMAPGDTAVFVIGGFGAHAIANVIATLPSEKFTLVPGLAPNHPVYFGAAEQVTLSWVASGFFYSRRGAATVSVAAPATATPTPSGAGGSSSSAGGGAGGGTGGGGTGSTGTGGTSNSQSALPTLRAGGANPAVNIPAPVDHGLPSPTHSPASPSGSITFPTVSPSAGRPTTSISTQVIVEAGAVRASHHGRPTALAIVSILALAAVTGAYLVQNVGGLGALRAAGAASGAGAVRRRGPTPGPRAEKDS